jgi:hypothetical protein
MTCIKLNNGFNGIACITPSFKPGDPPPDGYLAWHEWAEAQRKAGIKQVQCGRCGLWKTPQELNSKTLDFDVKDSFGNVINIHEHICSNCIK